MNNLIKRVSEQNICNCWFEPVDVLNWLKRNTSGVFCASILDLIFYLIIHCVMCEVFVWFLTEVIYNKGRGHVKKKKAKWGRSEWTAQLHPVGGGVVRLIWVKRKQNWSQQWNLKDIKLKLSCSWFKIGVSMLILTITEFDCYQVIQIELSSHTRKQVPMNYLSVHICW